jgi:hypothetical protein
MNIKIPVLVSSFVGCVALWIVFNPVTFGMCGDYCNPLIDQYQNVFLFFPAIFIMCIFSWNKYIFHRWWSFAKFTIPVCFLLLLAINYGVLETPTQGSFGFGSLVNSAINFWASVLVYSFFILGSLIQIFRGYREHKKVM